MQANLLGGDVALGLSIASLSWRVVLRLAGFGLSGLLLRVQERLLVEELRVGPVMHIRHAEIKIKFMSGHDVALGSGLLLPWANQPTICGRCLRIVP